MVISEGEFAQQRMQTALALASSIVMAAESKKLHDLTSLRNMRGSFLASGGTGIGMLPLS